MITCEPHASREFQRLLRTVLADESTRCFAIDPRVLARRIGIESERSTPSDTPMFAAERELLRVHRSELAYLLRTAVTLSETASRPGGSLASDAWRTCLREQVECMALDRVCVSAELTQLLERCCESELEKWPNAVELAQAALALHDVEAGRVLLGHALLDANRVQEATAAFADALTRNVHVANFGRLLDGLIEAQRRLGCSERARQLAECEQPGACEVVH